MRQRQWVIAPPPLTTVPFIGFITYMVSIIAAIINFSRRPFEDTLKRMTEVEIAVKRLKEKPKSESWICPDRNYIKAVCHWRLRQADW